MVAALCAENTERDHASDDEIMCSPSNGTVEDLSSALFAVASGTLSSPGASSLGGLQMSSSFNHAPVLVDEIAQLFTEVPPGVVIDATVGGAGHSAAILEANGSLGIVGFDRDDWALDAAGQRLEPFGDRVVVTKGRFDSLGSYVAAARTGDVSWPTSKASDPFTISGALFDLGVSSPQLDEPARGFSYMASAPLDMRMDPTSGIPASAYLDQLDEAELTAMLQDNGEGRLARRVARAVLLARPITTTNQLADVVAAAVPAAARRRGHPAKRVFQALRIAVNDELAQLSVALPTAIDLLTAGGRCVVLAYHSGEDRIVKTIFADGVTGGCTCPPQLPCVCGATPSLRLIRTASKKAGTDELAVNSRAASARLRVAEKLSAGESRP